MNKTTKKGRPNKYAESVKRGSFRIPKSEMDALMRIGSGSVNAGIRLAIKTYLRNFPNA